MMPLFKKRGLKIPKSKLIDEKYRIELAFVHDGVEYYHFPDQFQAPSGRQMMALAFYEELAMRCDKEYLEAHTKAIDEVLNSKKIQLQKILQLNMYLKERLELIPLPDYIYRMASVVFFDQSESIYLYDYEYNKKKIAKWKQSEDMLAFFLKTPLVELMPSLRSVIESSKIYFPVAEMIDKIHRDNLSEVLSAKESKSATHN